MNTILILLFMKASVSFNLPPDLLASLCFVESSHKVNLYHDHDGNSPSIGVCQIKLETAKLLGFKGNEAQLMVPKTNIHYAAKYLKKQLIRYNGDVLKAIAAYNSGTYHEYKPGIARNNRYVRKVFLVWEKNK